MRKRQHSFSNANEAQFMQNVLESGIYSKMSVLLSLNGSIVQLTVYSIFMIINNI
jgi:hypothetical protein